MDLMEIMTVVWEIMAVVFSGQRRLRVLLSTAMCRERLWAPSLTRTYLKCSPLTKQ